MPERIQRKRTKGWRKPEGSVMVTRPGRWGNPYSVEDWGLDLSLALFLDTTRGMWSPSTLGQDKSDEQFDRAYKAHTAWLKRMGGHPLEIMRYELAGHDLGCYCPLDQPCHADILLALANPHTSAFLTNER